MARSLTYDVLPLLNDVGVGPFHSLSRGSKWKPNLNSTAWAFESVREAGAQIRTTPVPASDIITIQYSTVPGLRRGPPAGGVNDAPPVCT